MPSSPDNLFLKEQRGPLVADLDRFTHRRWTYEELLEELPETSNHIELWEGEFIMSPSPSFFHQEIVARMFERLRGWVRERNLGQVILSPMDMILDSKTVCQPDLLFVSRDRLEIIKDRVRGAADLVVEVISDDSRTRDRINKRALYQQHGIKEYWLMDPQVRVVEVLSLEGNEFRMAGRWGVEDWAASQLLPGFKVQVADLFPETLNPKEPL